MRWRNKIERFPFARVMLFLGILFLYFPLIVLIAFSFSGSPLITVWGGWSLKWYHALMGDADILHSALLSMKVALMSSSCAVIIGLMAAYSLVRYSSFKGKSFFNALLLTPLVMPDVVLGISMLLMFVSAWSILGWPSRGIMTIVLAHITFCSAYVTIIIQARLKSVDEDLEEAAMDLGAKPLKTFFWITLPQIIPSLISAWLLSFTLSFDDLVITEFVAGPSQNTLPMYIYSTVKTGPSPEINALAAILIGVVALCVISATLVTFYSDRKRKKGQIKRRAMRQGKILN